MGRYLLRRLGFALAARLRRVVGGPAADAHRARRLRHRCRASTSSAEQRAQLRARARPRSAARRRSTCRGSAAPCDSTSAARCCIRGRSARSSANARSTPRCWRPIALLLATADRHSARHLLGHAHAASADRSSARCRSLGLSVPPLIGSLALVFLAARTGWFPVGGMTSSGGIDLTWAQWLADLARHLPLPALALAIPMAATLERLQSQAIAAASHERFVAASRARGVDRARSILRHAWPVSLRPVLGLYGVMIGSLFSGSFVVEVVTSWPGLGPADVRRAEGARSVPRRRLRRDRRVVPRRRHADRRPAAGLHRSARRDPESARDPARRRCFSPC